MILAPTLHSPGGRFLDADAVAFAASSGATELANLSAFFKGLKSGGLWDGFVGWSGRSGQNAGTGSTVFSFGGLGTYNGTLVNGPTWGSNGIAYTSAATQYMQAATFTATPASYLIGAVFNPATTGGGGSVIVAHNGTSTADAMQINDASANALSGGHRQVAGSTYVTPTAQTFTTSAFQFVQQGWTGTTVRRVQNRTSEQTAASAAFGGFITPLRINARGDTGVVGQNKTVAFAYMMHGKGADLATCQAIYDLYKSTIGQGLGLP